MSETQDPVTGTVLRSPAPRRLLVIYFVVVLILVGATLPVLIETLRVLDRQTSVYDPASAGVSQLLVGALNQETGVRGYALTGDASFLDPFHTGVTQFDQAAAELHRLDLGPAYQAQLAATVTAFHQWRAVADQEVADVASGQPGAARALEEQAESKARFDAFRAQEATLNTTVHDSVLAARRSLHGQVELSMAALGAAALVAVVVGMGMLAWWRLWGRRAAEQERHAADQAVLLQAAIDASSDGIFAKDVEGRHVLANRARRAALGGGDPETAVLGRRVADFLAPDLAHQIRTKELQVMETGESRQLEEVLPLHGHPRNFAVTKNPLRDATGRVVGIVGVARDVTEEQALRGDRERLYHLEHELATTLQLSMLGRDSVDDPRVETCARYRPAIDQLAVGGDWYDILALPKERVGLVVGDAVGHGIAAVTAMGKLRSALSAMVHLGYEPGPTLDAMDEFARATTGAAFATCHFTVVDVVEEQLTYSCAGQMPAVLVDPDGRVDVLDRTQDPPLGVARGGRRTAKLPFPPGSTVILYTDGLIERRGESLEVGFGRLVEAARAHRKLPVDQFCERLVDELVSPEEQFDDVAVVVARLADLA